MAKNFFNRPEPGLNIRPFIYQAPIYSAMFRIYLTSIFTTASRFSVREAQFKD